MGTPDSVLGPRPPFNLCPISFRLKVDLFVVGSVAVDTRGRRIGKGEGFADLEFAMGASHHHAVGPETVVVTTVHDVQVFDPEHLPGTVKVSEIQTRSVFRHIVWALFM